MWTIEINHGSRDIIYIYAMYTYSSYYYSWLSEFNVSEW